MNKAREELIARLRAYGSKNYEPARKAAQLIELAAAMLEADARQQYGWIRACDEEMVSAHLGVANLSDSYESAKQKLGELIAWHVAVATDPAVNGGLSLQPAAPQEPVAWMIHSPDWMVPLVNVHKPTALFTGETVEPLFAAPQPQRPRLTDDEIIQIAKTAQSAEPGRDGYVLPIAFARTIEKKVRGEA